MPAGKGPITQTISPVKMQIAILYLTPGPLNLKEFHTAQKGFKISQIGQSVQSIVRKHFTPGVEPLNRFSNKICLTSVRFTTQQAIKKHKILTSFASKASTASSIIHTHLLKVLGFTFTMEDNTLIGLYIFRNMKAQIKCSNLDPSGKLLHSEILFHKYARTSKDTPMWLQKIGSSVPGASFFLPRS